jgi:hypothetical protein
MDVATLKAEFLLAAHPVGSYYFSDDSTSPATLFGGTWVALDPGRVLLSQGTYTDSNGSVTYTVGTTGGERLHQLTVDEMPSHKHLTAWGDKGLIPWGGSSTSDNAGNHSSPDYDNPYPYTSPVGNDTPHNNVQPYKAVYAWTRTL